MRTLKEFLTLALTLCREDLEERFAGSVLGRIWCFIWPLVLLTVYLVVFGTLMGARLGGDAGMSSYGVYLASGLFPWTAFAATLQRTTRLFMDKRDILRKVYVDPRVFPLAFCLSELLPLAFGLILLFGVNLALGWRPDPDLLFWALFALFSQQAMAMGLGLFFACCTAFLRDTAEAVAMCLQIAFWFTPVVYLPDILPGWAANLLLINPMTHALFIYHKAFVFGGEIGITAPAVLLFFSLLFLFLGFSTFRSWQKDIRDVL
ncbi:MAG: ABC transporter permease [Desulfovibrio sp.]|nr:ABC transporter permease [Desulfovibrio sp.]